MLMLLWLASWLAIASYSSIVLVHDVEIRPIQTVENPAGIHELLQTKVTVMEALIIHLQEPC